MAHIPSARHYERMTSSLTQSFHGITSSSISVAVAKKKNKTEGGLIQIETTKTLLNLFHLNSVNSMINCASHKKLIVLVRH